MHLLARWATNGSVDDDTNVDDYTEHFEELITAV